MAATIVTKNSSTTGAVPTSGDLVQGELAVNVTDTGLYTENASGTVVKLNAPSIDDKNTGATKYVTIASGGNVGVGTSSPSSWGKFVSSGTSPQVVAAGSSGAGGQVSVFSNGATTLPLQIGQGYATASDGVAYISQQANQPLIFRTNATETMRIDSSGNLLVGGTSTSFGALSSQGLTTTGYGVGSRTTGGGAALYGGWSGSTNVFVVYGNGNVANTNNSYGAISDVKLKENITDATPKLAQLNQVRVVNYNLIGDEHKQLGVIAQELEQIFPSMIEETVDRDAEGNDLGTTTKGVKYSVFVPMLIKAIQEQQALINNLTERLDALESK